MNTQEYIASGKLELYVAGLLSRDENLEVYRYAQEYPEIQKEIEEIEGAILEISKAASPGLSNNNFEVVESKLGKVVQLPASQAKKSNWSYVGWAASLLFGAGLLWLYMQNQELQSTIETVNQENQTLQEQIINAREEVADSETLLDQLRDKNIAVVALGGQNVSPTSFAKAYWNNEQQKVFIDAQGLPEPPEGYAYQVWSLKLDPLTPTSIGMLDDFADNSEKIFELENPNSSEAFGITLEPEGGSESPTLEQLYTLGVVGR